MTMCPSDPEWDDVRSSELQPEDLIDKADERRKLAQERADEACPDCGSSSVTNTENAGDFCGECGTPFLLGLS